MHSSDSVIFPSYDNLQNKQTFAHYTIDKKIGVGGMSVVYRAYDNKIQRIVALKILKKQQQSCQNLLREAQMMSKVNHPNMINIYEINTHPCFYFSMEYIDGETLHEWAFRNDDFSVQNLSDIFIQLATAINEIHKHSIIHRDIKPTNILITQDRKVKLMDFGISKVMPKNMPREFSENTPIGTPKYMAPEQVSGNANYKSDIYGFGATLYEILSGKAPFQGEIHNIIFEILTKDPISPSCLNSNISPEMETICLKCMQKNPDHRYSSAKQLVRDLKNAQANKPLLAKKYTKIQAIKKFIQRNMIKTLLILICSCMIILFGLREIWQKQQLEQLKNEVNNVREITTKVLKNTLLLSQSLQKNEKLLQPIRALLETIPQGKKKYPILFSIAFGLSKNTTNVEEVITSITKQIAKEPKNTNLYLQRGNIYKENGLLKKALADYKKALQIYPSHAVLLVAKGNVLQKMRKYYAAMKSYDQAIYLNPEYSNAYYNRGNLHKFLNKKNAAIHDYENATSYNPSDSKGYNNLSLVYLQIKNKKKALENATKAVSLEKNNWKYMYNRSNIYAQMGKYKKAIEDCKKALRIKNDIAIIYYKLGILYRILQKNNKAIKNLKKAISLNQLNKNMLIDAQEKLKKLK